MAGAPGTADRLVSRLRIAAGRLRQSTVLEWRWFRARPKINRSAQPLLERLAAVRAQLPEATPLVGLFLGEHFGDIVSAEPIVREVRRRHPQAHLIYACKPGFAELVQAHPDVQTVLPIESILQTEPLIRRGPFDAVYDLHVVGKHCGRHGLSYRKRWGNPSIDARSYYHHGSLLDALCLTAGLSPLGSAQPRLHLPLSVSARVDALQLPERLIVFHGISNELIRNWDSAKWRELLRLLRPRLPHTFAEVGLTSVLPDGERAPLDLCGRLSVAETAEVIRRADLFVGIDSGPSHCANAFERPSVVLLGKYLNFENYMPYTGHFAQHADRQLLRWPGACRDIPVEAVAERVLRQLTG